MIRKPKVLVGISMHGDARARLHEVADVDSWPGDARDLRRTIGEYDGLIVYSPRFDVGILAKAERLKVISISNYC